MGSHGSSRRVLDRSRCYATEDVSFSLRSVRNTAYNHHTTNRVMVELSECNCRKLEQMSSNPAFAQILPHIWCSAFLCNEIMFSTKEGYCYMWKRVHPVPPPRSLDRSCVAGRNEDSGGSVFFALIFSVPVIRNVWSGPFVCTGRLWLQLYFRCTQGSLLP